MNRLLIAATATLLAFPLLAGDAKPAKTGAKPAQKAAKPAAQKPAAQKSVSAKAAQTPAEQPAALNADAPQPGDSPLVAAAKRANLRRQQQKKSPAATSE